MLNKKAINSIIYCKALRMPDLMSADSQRTDDSLIFEIKNNVVKKLELHTLCESSPVEMIHIICEVPILLKNTQVQPSADLTSDTVSMADECQFLFISYSISILL